MENVPLLPRILRGWSPLSALTAAAVGTGLVAFIIGAPILRVRGHYLAMITLAFSQIVILVSTRWTEVTGGLTGIPGVRTSLSPASPSIPSSRCTISSGAS